MKTPLFNSKNKELIIKKIEKKDPSVLAAFSDKKTLLNADLTIKNNTIIDTFLNKINAISLIKNAENKIELNQLIANNLSSNNTANKAELNALIANDLSLINEEKNKQSINNDEIGPLSIKPFLDTISSNSNTFLPLIPQIKPKNKRELNNSLAIGYGKSVLSAYNNQQLFSTFSVIYLRRFTPLMSIGLNSTYSKLGTNNHTFSTDIQLDFTLLKRKRWEMNLTTGYGFRNWHYSDAIIYSDNSKGVTIGCEIGYFPFKNYFINCRLDAKETKVFNTSFLLQIGKLF
jgi:hypothetical protein